MPESTLDLPPDSPDLIEAEQLRYSDGVLRIAPLSSGKWAIYGHCAADSLLILASLDLGERLREMSGESVAYGRRQKARFTTAEARFYGEPSDRQFIRDLRRGNREPRVTEAEIEDLAIDI